MIRFKACSLCGFAQLPSQYVYRLHGETKYRAHCKRCMSRRHARWRRNPEVQQRERDHVRRQRTERRAWLSAL